MCLSGADPAAVYREPRPVYAPAAGRLSGGAADEVSGQRGEGQETGTAHGETKDRDILAVNYTFANA